MKSFPMQCKDIRTCKKENRTEDNQLTGRETMTKKEEESEKRKKENVGTDENREAQVFEKEHSSSHRHQTKLLPKLLKKFVRRN